eukprot:TRINITY_DN4664_c0_g1_i3.p2 TRINITY_DN4664_c0_g1~~TRINITY_DN4664_c0_g1_i3.p2  ORF type:complete len:114 (-),score=16.65 TRINITY_DN4664_c0_g1_i3:307-648(-)
MNEPMAPPAKEAYPLPSQDFMKDTAPDMPPPPYRPREEDIPSAPTNVPSGATDIPSAPTNVPVPKDPLYIPSAPGLNVDADGGMSPPAGATSAQPDAGFSDLQARFANLKRGR